MKLKKFFFKKVISTNDTAIRLIKLGNEKGAILSEHQSKGRGQRGNKWTSKKGNLFMTVFFEISKKLSVKKIINLNILIIKNIISKKIISILNIKKPNDIFINKKKVCGILQEMIFRNDKKFGRQHYFVQSISGLTRLPKLQLVMRTTYLACF